METPSSASWSGRRSHASSPFAFAVFIGVTFVPLLLPFAVILALLFLAAPFYLVYTACRDKEQQYTDSAKAFAVGLCAGDLIAACVLAFQQQTWAAVAAAVFGFLLLLFGLLGATHHARTYLGRVRPGVGRMCFACRYDLESLPDHRPCPECGALIRYEFRSPSKHQRSTDHVESAYSPPRSGEGE